VGHRGAVEKGLIQAVKKMSENGRMSLASRVLQGVTSRMESATRVQWDELRRLPKQLSSSSISIGSEVRKLRSRSCERVLRKCRGLGRAVHGKESQELDTFHQSATLRRSRRCRTDKARPVRKSYESYARAVVDVTPSPYDTEALPLHTGDLIGVIHKHPSGTWLGECEGKVGRFKFINVVEMEGLMPGETRTEDEEEKDGELLLDASSVPELLASLGLHQLTSLLELNGWDRLDKLEGLDRRQLEYLGVSSRRDQTRLLGAVARLGVGGRPRTSSLCSSSSPSDSSFPPSSSSPSSSSPPSSSSLMRPCSDLISSPPLSPQRPLSCISFDLSSAAASQHADLSSSTMDLSLPSPPSEMPRSLRTVQPSDSFLLSSENLAIQLANCLQLEEDERERKKSDDEKKEGGDELCDLLKVSDIEKFKKLPSNLTLSILSPELNKSF